MQLIYFLTEIAFWFMKYVFLIDGGTEINLVVKKFILCCVDRLTQPLWKIYGITQINFDYNWFD